MRMLRLVAVFLVFVVPLLAKEVALPNYPSQSAIPYHYVTTKRGDTLRKLFGKDWTVISRFNRIDERHLKAGMMLRVPDDLEAARNYTPMPMIYEKASSHKRYAVIDIREQFLGAYEYGALQFSLPISSANPECLDNKFRKKTCYTPLGNFRVLAFHANHSSSIYRDAVNGENVPMPYAVLFTVEETRGKKFFYWIHGGDLPGRPDSHGCIRLMPDDAKRLFLWLGGNPEKEGVMWIKNGAPIEVKGEQFSYTRQGGVALEELPPNAPLPETAFVEKTENGTGQKIRNAAVFQKEGKNYVIAPIAVDDIPGKYEIVAYANDGSVLYRKILLIDRGEFPISRSLIWNRGTFTKNQLERIAKEKKEMSHAYESGRQEPLWSDGFSSPIEAGAKAGIITHHFGEIRVNPKNKRSRYHFGVDILAPKGQPIRSIANGRVAHVGKEYLLEGNITIIDHGAGIFSLYLHQSEVLVVPGETVTKGQIIGKVGNTGNAFGPHLHLATKVNGVMVDPMKVIEILRQR